MEILNPQPLPEKTVNERANPSPGFLRRLFQSVGFRTTKNALQSENFVSGSTGWQLTADGDFEGNSGTFRGSLIAESIDIPDTTTADSFHVDNQGNTWWGATLLANALAKITKAGVATFRSVTSSISVNLKNLDQYVTGEAIDASSTPQAVYKDSSDGKVYKTAANNSGKRFFFGLVENAQNISSGGNAQVAVEGIVGGFSGLTNGLPVYLSDTAGAISHTPSTTAVIRVGIAISSTQILIITAGKKSLFGTSSLSTTTQNQTVTNTVTIGFRPRIIVCSSTANAGAGVAAVAIGTGFWGDSSGQGWAGTNGGALDIIAESGYICRSSIHAGHTNDVLITITNPTETTFDIAFQITGVQTGVTNTATVIFTAFGE